MEQFTGKRMQSSAQPPFGHLLEADSATREGYRIDLAIVAFYEGLAQPAYCVQHAVLSLPAGQSCMCIL